MQPGRSGNQPIAIRADVQHIAANAGVKTWAQILVADAFTEHHAIVLAWNNKFIDSIHTIAKIEQVGVVTGATIENVVARATGENIVTRFANEHIIAIAAKEAVVAVTAHQLVVALATGNRVVSAHGIDVIHPRQPTDGVIAFGRHIVVHGRQTGIDCRGIPDGAIGKTDALDGAAGVAIRIAAKMLAHGDLVTGRAIQNDKVVAPTLQLGHSRLITASQLHGVRAAGFGYVHAGAVPDRVKAVTQCKHIGVVAAAAVELIVAGAAGNGVFTAKGLHPIVTTLSIDGVIERSAEQRVCLIGANDRREIRQVGHCAIGELECINGARTRRAENSICETQAVTAAGKLDDDIAILLAKPQVLAADTGTKLHAIARSGNGRIEDHVLAIADVEEVGVKPGPADQRIVARVAREQIVAIHAGNEIVALVAEQPVVAKLTREIVVATLTREGVVAVAAGNEFRARCSLQGVAHWRRQVAVAGCDPVLYVRRIPDCAIGKRDLLNRRIWQRNIEMVQDYCKVRIER